MQSGKLYFFTATILHWKPLLAHEECMQIIGDEWKRLVMLRRISIYAFIIMPNHYHIIWSVEEPYHPDNIQRDFHKWTAKKLIKWMTRYQPHLLKDFTVNAADRAIQIWERNPLPIELYSQEVIWQKLEYIHNNPCRDKWQLAELPELYHYSSAQYYLLNKDEWGFITHIQQA
ncbi:MAG: transposase [Chitinophagales bacterium]|nr:transposase [Chitinophagales bacterium]